LEPFASSESKNTVDAAADAAADDFDDFDDLKRVARLLQNFQVVFHFFAKVEQMGVEASCPSSSSEDRLIFICNKNVSTDLDPRNFPSFPTLEALTLLSKEIGEIEVNKLLGRQGFCIFVRGSPAPLSLSRVEVQDDRQSETSTNSSSSSSSSSSTLEVLGYAVASEFELSDALIDRWKQGLESHWNKLNEEPIIIAISELVILQKHRGQCLSKKLIQHLKNAFSTTRGDNSSTVVGIWPVAPRESELEFARTVLLDFESGAFTTWFILTQSEEAGSEPLDGEEADDSHYFSWDDWKECGDLTMVKSRISTIAKTKDWDIQTLCQDYAKFLSTKYSGTLDVTCETEQEEGGGGGLGFQREFAEAVALLTFNDLFSNEEEEVGIKDEEIETYNKSNSEHIAEDSNINESSSSSSTSTKKKRIGIDNVEDHQTSSSVSKKMKSTTTTIEDNLG
jgi:hypothetical protein